MTVHPACVASGPSVGRAVAQRGLAVLRAHGGGGAGASEELFIDLGRRACPCA